MNKHTFQTRVSTDAFPPFLLCFVDLQTTITARQRLESQREENLSVQREFTTLSRDSKIYKLVGPILLTQDKDDAKRTVDGRLEFIEKEIRRVEGTIREGQEKDERLREELGRLQEVVQMAEQKQLQGVGVGA